MLTGAGALHGDNVFSHASLLLDCEVFAMAARFGEGIEIRDEDIALDMIVDVGPGGPLPRPRPHAREHAVDLA